MNRQIPKPHDPVEVFHGKVLELFHKYRTAQGGSTSISLNGMELNEILTEAKQQAKKLPRLEYVGKVGKFDAYKEAHGASRYYKRITVDPPEQENP